jgi:hypothetical protein
MRVGGAARPYQLSGTGCAAALRASIARSSSATASCGFFRSFFTCASARIPSGSLGASST